MTVYVYIWTKLDVFFLSKLSPVWPTSQRDWSIGGCLSKPSETLKSHTYISFFYYSDPSGDQKNRYVYKVALWIQESCRSFVLIHPDKTILSIPFEKWRTGILWNHRRSQETMYHMLLKFYCFIHLFGDFFMPACSSCSLLCCFIYRNVTFTSLQKCKESRVSYSDWNKMLYNSKLV